MWMGVLFSCYTTQWPKLLDVIGNPSNGSTANTFCSLWFDFLNNTHGLHVDLSGSPCLSPCHHSLCMVACKLTFLKYESAPTHSGWPSISAETFSTLVPRSSTATFTRNDQLKSRNTMRNFWWIMLTFQLAPFYIGSDIYCWGKLWLIGCSSFAFTREIMKARRSVFCFMPPVLPVIVKMARDLQY